MSWWGSGKKEEKKPEVQEERFPPTYINEEEVIAANGPRPDPVGTAEFQKKLQAEQQKMLIQAVILKLTDISFDHCVTAPSYHLSGAERSCLLAVTNKYLETGEIIGEKMAKLK
jgi:hypothetical protein